MKRPLLLSSLPLRERVRERGRLARTHRVLLWTRPLSPALPREGGGSKGFTLIEVLAAVAVLAIALAAIISGMARYADNAGYLREKTLALWVAHNRLTEIELEPAWPAEGKSDGDVEMAGADWTWRVEVKKTPDDKLRRVDITVSRKGDEAVLSSLSGFVAEKLP